MNLQDKAAQATQLFKTFHGREPKQSELVTINQPDGPVLALEVGILVGLSYRAAGTGEEFYHDFEGTRPKLYVTQDGSQIYVTGGVYRFTDRGFIK